MNKLLITGGAGFIGSHIIELLKDNYDIKVLDDFSAGKKENVPRGIKLIEKKVQRIDKDDVKNADMIIHMAAQVSTFSSVNFPYYDFKTNCVGTFKLYEALRKYNPKAKVLYTSSRSVHSNIPEGKCDEKTPFNPETFYNTHKIYGEHLAKIYKELYNIDSVVMRLGNVYGPRQPAKGLYNFVCRWAAYAVQGKPIPIWGTGNQIRDWVYVKDIAKGYKLALETKKALNETFLFSTGRETTLLELANKIFSIAGKKPEIQFFPPKKGDIFRFVGDSSKAEKILGWSPKYSLEKGLEELIEYIHHNKQKYKEYNLK